jgi:hypothetical protein
MDESEIQAYQRLWKKADAHDCGRQCGGRGASVDYRLPERLNRALYRPAGCPLADVATQVSGGNLQVVAKLKKRRDWYIGNRLQHHDWPSTRS